MRTIAVIAVCSLAAGCGLDESIDRAQGALLEEDVLAGVVMSEEELAAEEDSDLSWLERRGKRLFEKAHFNGNGRRCATCHPSAPGESGTLSPEDIEALFAKQPDHPLFQWDGADTFGGDTFDRLREHATILVELALPDNVRIVGSDARSVVVPRAIPTTLNTPALDPVLMWDGRAPNLQEQAFGAISGHAQTTNVSDDQLDAIAAFELTLFSGEPLRAWANGGPEPELPLGTTESEKRGRKFFTPTDSPEAQCGHCHGGPNLDETVEMAVVLGQVPPGTRFFSVMVSEFNVIGNPVYTFEFTDPLLGVPTAQVTSPDPGRALITGDPRDANAFKINSLWGIQETAPYFHDNSAKTLEDVLEHYDRFFNESSLGFVDLTEQDKADIVAYMKLL